jgi:sugar lactone lactonase YvrE
MYIADTSIVGTTPALIVYDIDQRRAVRFLSSHSSLYGNSHLLDVQGYQVKLGPIGLRVNVDSIALDRSGTSLYFGAVTNDKLYNISTKEMLDFFQNPLMANITDVSFDELQSMKPKTDGDLIKLLSHEKPLTDGISTDMQGNIWLTAFAKSSIAIAKPPSYKIVKVMQSQQLRWPDGFSFGPDGLYITSSALHLAFSGEDMARHAPFHIHKISLGNLKLALGKNFVLPPYGQ